MSSASTDPIGAAMPVERAAAESARTRRMAFALVWAAAVIAGAAVLRGARLERWLPWLAVLGKHESVHIVAHTLIYGTLAAVARGLWSRWWAPFALVLGVGFLQEAAQTLLFGKGMGRAEAFDLTVDLCAAALGVCALAATRWAGARRRSTKSS